MPRLPLSCYLAQHTLSISRTLSCTHALSHSPISLCTSVHALPPAPRTPPHTHTHPHPHTHTRARAGTESVAVEQEPSKGDGNKRRSRFQPRVSTYSNKSLKMDSIRYMRMSVDFSACKTEIVSKTSHPVCLFSSRLPLRLKGICICIPVNQSR